MLSLQKRGRAAAVVGAAALAGSLALATPAFASGKSPSAANNTIIGSGSATTYQVMTSLGDLFNGFPGCNMITPSGTPQPLNYSCVAPANPNTAQYAENPLNDVAYEEPPLGSSNGIQQLEDQAAASPPVAVAPANFARSSRASKGTDDAGLNFVAYAKDGVSWFHFTEVDGHPTASANVHNLTVAQLQAIATGTGTGGITNWDKVGGGNAPILVFAAQAGSGTESTWESAISAAWSTTAIKESKTGTTNHVVFENEDRQIIAATQATSPTGATTYIGNIIFLFSYGKYTVSCTTGPKVCGGTPVPGTSATKPTKNEIGQINGVAPTIPTILCTTVGPTCPKGPFPVPRFIYNVYANSHSSSDAVPLVPASPATLNFASEAGFICKPNTGVLDPVTGVSVRAEITSTISGAGFIPLPTVANEDNGVNFPATFATGSPYKQWDNPPDKPGFCIVSSTG
jgi:ABC-type phosphate transport system substrate-binding protein